MYTYTDLIYIFMCVYIQLPVVFNALFLYLTIHIVYEILLIFENLLLIIVVRLLRLLERAKKPRYSTRPSPNKFLFRQYRRSTVQITYFSICHFRFGDKKQRPNKDYINGVKCFFFISLFHNTKYKKKIVNFTRITLIL